MCVFFFKQKTAYEMRISDWSSDVCSSDLPESPTPASAAPKHVYLVDGSGYIFRAFHALPPMTRADGTPVNAVLGFTNMLLHLIEQAEADEAADYFAVIFDTARVSFRNDIYAGYKAQRPETPAELIPQFGLIREATRAPNLDRKSVV